MGSGEEGKDLIFGLVSPSHPEMSPILLLSGEAHEEGRRRGQVRDPLRRLPP
jgi:hypothetical protein